jgi:hypothetical protein
MKKIGFYLIALVLISCSEEHEQSDFLEKMEVEIGENIPFEERVQLHVRSQLSIPGSEKHDIQIYKSDLTGDGIDDAIVTVNRLEYAISRSQEKKAIAKSSELDFWGAYNVVFYYDSELDKLSPPLEFNSTPLRSLKISFQNISSSEYKDVIIDYPLRNSEFRIFLPIINHAPTQVLQWQVYDGWGTDKVEANCFSYDKGSFSPFKDILIKKAYLKNISNEENYNTAIPEITCSDELVHRFFFNPKDNKYYTKK